MTRKEAIEELKLIRANFNYRINGTSNFDKALKYAIASLETDEAYQLNYEKPEECEDCISRKAALKVFGDIHPLDFNANAYYSKIKTLPSVLPKTDKPTIIDWNNCHTPEQLESISTTKNDLAVEKIDMIDKSNFSQEQYKTDLQSAYDCGYAQAKNNLGVDVVSRKAVLNTLDNMDSALDEDRTVETYKELLKECYKVLPSVTSQEPIEKCTWIKYDYRTMCPKEHDIDNPYWRIPENRMKTLKYCPYCGKEIEVEE